MQEIEDMLGDIVHIRSARLIFETVLGGSVALFLSSASALAVPTYTVMDLGTLGGSFSYGYGINDSGQVTGSAYTSGPASRAFLYNGTNMVDLGTLGGTSSEGFGINNSGQVTGYSYTSGDTAYRAFLHDGTSMVDLGTLGGNWSFGQAINDAGQVTGASYSGNYRAFLHNGTSMVDLGTLGGTDSGGTSINNSGQVTGASTTSGNSDWHAFLYNGTSMVDIGTLGGTHSSGTGINNSGQVTGYATTSGNAIHAFLYNGTTMIDLGTLGGVDSLGFDVNDSGQVVGRAANTNGNELAFLYDEGTMFDINGLIDPLDPLYGDVRFYDARGINDSGDIVANGCYTSGPLSGQCHAFLLDSVVLTAVPEPATLALFGAGLLCLGLLKFEEHRPPADKKAGGAIVQAMMVTKRPFRWQVRPWSSGFGIATKVRSYTNQTSQERWASEHQISEQYVSVRFAIAAPTQDHSTLQ